MYDGHHVVRVVGAHELTTTDDPSYAGPLQTWWGLGGLGLSLFGVSFGRRAARRGSWARAPREVGGGGRLEAAIGTTAFTAALAALGVEWFGPASPWRFMPPVALLALVAWVLRRRRTAVRRGRTAGTTEPAH